MNALKGVVGNIQRHWLNRGAVCQKQNKTKNSGRMGDEKNVLATVS